MYTLDTIVTAPSYEALAKAGFSKRQMVEYYTLPHIERSAFFIAIKNGESVEKSCTQKCTRKLDLFREVDGKLREYMQTDFVVNGKTYNMIKMGYAWKWNNNKSRFGVHKLKWKNTFSGREFIVKSIELSRYMLEKSDKTLADWIDTILHEIAHAIDFAIRGESNHDWHWVKIAKMIGCNGERCGSHKVKHDYKYTAECSCGATYKRHKLLQQIRYASCGRCNTPIKWKQRF